MYLEFTSINKRTFQYVLKKSKKAKYLRIEISSNGIVTLIIPFLMNNSEGLKFLSKKSDWVLSKLDKVRKPSQIAYLGENLSEQEIESIKIGTADSYRKWLKSKAEIYLIERTKFLAKNFGFTVNRITLRFQKTRWGSCSFNKNISLNIMLMKLPIEIIDYVIIHELCHTIFMDHSKSFWGLVEKYSPNYKILRKQLKSITV